MNKENHFKQIVMPALLLLALVMVGCKSKSGQPNEPRTVAVKVLTLSDGQADGSLSYSGSIEEDNVTIASFLAAGTVKTLAISQGQRIQKGQYIGSVDATQPQNALDAACAMLAQAQDAYDRVKMLYESKSVPEIKWVEVQSKLQQAKSSEQMARKAVADCRLYAPASGVVSEKLVEAGQNVAPGMPVAKIVGVGSLKAKVSVPEGEISALRLGQKATVEVDALGGRVFDAVVSEKGIMASALSRSYDVKLRIVGGSADLMPGMVAKVCFAHVAPIDKQRASRATLIVPANVVQIDDNNQYFVWTVRDGKALKVVVSCGGFVGDGVVIESGLNAGDQVIVEGQHKVSNGTNVTIR